MKLALTKGRLLAATAAVGILASVWPGAMQAGATTWSYPRSPSFVSLPAGVALPMTAPPALAMWSSPELLWARSSHPVVGFTVVCLNALCIGNMAVSVTVGKSDVNVLGGSLHFRMVPLGENGHDTQQMEVQLPPRKDWAALFANGQAKAAALFALHDGRPVRTSVDPVRTLG